MSRSPGMFSRQAAASGKTAAIRSSASMRWSGGGTFLPPRLRGTASEMVVFQRQRVLGRGGLQLEIELTAEALAQRESPRLVHAAAERRVQHELHPAGLVE